MELRELVCTAAFRSFEGEVLRISQRGVVPFSVVNAAKLKVEVAAGVCAQLVLLFSEPHSSTICIELAEGAHLETAQIFMAEAFVELTITQAAGSECRITTVQLTSANIAYRIDLNGAEAENALYGVFLATDDEHCVVNLRTNHNVPDCRSNSVIKGVAGGCARGEFCGLVYVAPDAQRTDARQQSRNLELSNTAHITIRPQLEIYADDVKCSHGATVGQTEVDAVLYMRQRGLSETQARRLQIEGFVGDVVSHCRIEPLQELLMQAVTAKLEKL